jgi:hypothetical protein
VTPRVVRLTAAILAGTALAVAGCGSERHASAPAPPAADLVPLTTAQAARMAQRIAVVESRGSRVIEGAPGTPFTRTTFAVQRVVKGTLPHQFVLQVVGGRLGDTVVDSPVQSFTRSGRYVLFLGPDGPAGPTIIPQAVLEVKPGELDQTLAPIRRALQP